MYAFTGPAPVASSLCSRVWTSRPFCSSFRGLTPQWPRTSRALRRKPGFLLSMTAATSSTKQNQQIYSGKGFRGPKDVIRSLARLSAPLWRGERKLTAWAWTVVTAILALGATTYAVLLSFVYRTFYDALNARNRPKFNRLIMMYTFAVIVGPAILSLYAWCKERLSLMWRDVLTQKYVKTYFCDRNYYRIAGNTIDNPDQRLSEDIKAFTSQAVRFTCVFLEAVFDLVVFSGILYRIYPPLYMTLLVYSVFGTAVIVYYGRRLVGLDKKQRAREADYRFGLVRCRENAESIAFYKGEESELSELLTRFKAAFLNCIRLLGLRRDVGFLSTTYIYFVQVLPSIVLGPLYFANKIKVGAISQSMFSFNRVLTGLGLVVKEFTSLSEIGAGLSRINEIDSSMTESPPLVADTPDFSSDGNIPPALEVEGLSVVTPGIPSRVLVQDLSLQVKKGGRLLVIGESGVGKSSLLRCIAGLWNQASGRVFVPDLKETMFLPQRPYLTLGSLRENVTYPRLPDSVSDEEILSTLRLVNLPEVVERMGGLDTGGELLGSQLSLGEQQRLAFARLVLCKPSMCILDESTSALDVENESAMYKILMDMGITCISVGNRPTLYKFHDTVLSLNPGGQWNIEPASKAVERQKYKIFS